MGQVTTVGVNDYQHDQDKHAKVHERVLLYQEDPPALT